MQGSKLGEGPQLESVYTTNGRCCQKVEVQTTEDNMRSLIAGVDTLA